MFHLNFLYIAVSWVLLRWHDLFTLIGFSDASGWGWALSIIFLVITARVLLFRLFIKQVHYTRNMQKMQPKIQKLREKYKDDKPELNRQMMALQQEEGFNPLSGCLPMLLQIPVFIGLFHTLRHVSNSVKFCNEVGAPRAGISEKASNLLGLYTFSPDETCHAASARILGAPLAAAFRDSGDKIRALGGEHGATIGVLVVLLIVSSGATLGTQLLVRANATSVPEGQAATIQRLMLFLIPIGTLASGLIFNFPLGVLLYWFTSNLWTLGQQAYIIRFHPPEDDKAEPVGVVGKTLAPPPGARPTRDRRGRPGGGSPTGGSGGSPSRVSMAKGDQAPSSNGHGSGAAAGAPRSAAAGTAPRAGQKPNRPSGKRPTKSKKRR